MRKTKLLFELAFISLIATSCVSHYQLTSVQRTRILVDHRYDSIRNEKVDAMMRPYKNHVDSIMSPVVGRVKRNMSVGRPESTLSNLLSDILVWGGRAFHETPDFAVYNMGGKIKREKNKWELGKIERHLKYGLDDVEVRK